MDAELMDIIVKAAVTGLSILLAWAAKHLTHKVGVELDERRVRAAINDALTNAVPVGFQMVNRAREQAAALGGGPADNSPLVRLAKEQAHTFVKAQLGKALEGYTIPKELNHLVEPEQQDILVRGAVQAAKNG